MKKFDNKIVVYQNKTGSIAFRGDFRRETIWATQAQIVDLFDVDQSVVSRHIRNIFGSGEVAEKSNMQKMHIAGSDKPVIAYSLDVILSVGYRTNSSVAISFRKWATKTLRDHIVKGYTINRHRLAQAADRLKELQGTVLFLQRKSKHKLLAGQEKEILALLSDYAKTLTLLEGYDDDRINIAGGIKGKYRLTYETAADVIIAVKKELRAGDLFGKEYNHNLQAIIGNIYQTQKGKELYATLEEKAAHLLYFIIKDHPFVDGNKRIASFLFVYLLDRNNYLYKRNGERKINDNALTALTLLIAVSQPKEMQTMIKIIINLLAR